MYIHGGVIDLQGISNELWQFSQGNRCGLVSLSGATVTPVCIRDIGVAETAK